MKTTRETEAKIESESNPVYDQIVAELKEAMSEQGWMGSISSLRASPALAGREPKELKKVLVDLEKKGIVAMDTFGQYYWLEQKKPPVQKVQIKERMDNAPGCKYLDHANVLPTLELFYTMKVPVIIVGEHGTGKTDAVREFCRQKGLTLYNVPCSLGLREHHFVGRLNRKESGEIVLKKGPVPLSMEDENGGVLYLDELNAAEADVLLRMDEVLDGRRQITIEGETLIANAKWWCVATINPLDHAGTKELPNQLMSRFAHRIHLTYPKDIATEQHLVYKCLNVDATSLGLKETGIHEKVISSIRQLRDPSMELPYQPSLRESIAAVKLLIDGAPLVLVTKHILIAPYYQWGQTTTSKVVDFLMSKLGSENVSG